MVAGPDFGLGMPRKRDYERVSEGERAGDYSHGNTAVTLSPA
jgi:hypothetical protein